MNRLRSLTIGTLLIFAPAILARQGANSTKGAAQRLEVPNVRDQLKVLTDRLDLTAGQQPKVKAILQELHGASQKLAQDVSLSHDQQLEKVRSLRMKANQQLREILNDDQKKKLDQYLAGPHSEMHGNLHGTPRPPAQQPQH